jgi:hypothetical protein
VAARYFTLEEARAALEELRPLAEEMVERHRRLLEAQLRRSELAGRAGSNGGDLTPGDFAAVEQELEREATELARCVERIQAEGVLVKDLERGLLDFPSKREGRDVLLCWHVGEAEIAYYHGADEGFAGRKPL